MVEGRGFPFELGFFKLAGLFALGFRFFQGGRRFSGFLAFLAFLLRHRYNKILKNAGSTCWPLGRYLVSFC